MSLTNVIFNNFKNLKGEFPLGDRINVIIGNNGQGKTNFLEGLYYLSFGTGMGNSSDENNINWKSKNGFFRISTLTDLDDETKVEVVYENTVAGGRKKFLVNDISRVRRNFMGNVSSVVFAPQTVDLVSGSPDGRRKAIDDILSLLDNEYAEILGKYKNVLRNRNKILSNLSGGIGNKMELVYWNDALIENGSYIIFKRATFFNDKSGEFIKKAKALFNSEFKKLKISYLSKFIEEGEKGVSYDEIYKLFKEKVDGNIEKEIWSGATLYGPHREDFDFSLGNMILRESGSRGQQRLASLIFILTIFDILEKRNGTNAVLLLDDIMSELDPVHRGNIEKMLLDKKSQVIITTAEEENFTKNFLKSGRVIRL